MANGKIDIAARKYAEKVCKLYLGIDPEACIKLFKDKLIPNMKAGILAAAKVVE